MNIIFKNYLVYNDFVDPKFYKFLYFIALCALIVAIMTIYKGLSEINLFFNERIKI